MSHAIGIVGSHHWNDYDAFCLAVGPYLKGVRELVSGGAPGVDTMVGRLARDFGIPYTDYPVEQQIVDAADALIAMPGPESTDTWGTIDRAKQKGIEVVLIEAPV